MTVKKNVPLCKQCVSGKTTRPGATDRTQYRWCDRYNDVALNVRPTICKGENFVSAAGNPNGN